MAQIIKMRDYIYIILLLIVFAGCHQTQPENGEINLQQQCKIKVCKMYSSDFVLLDPNERGQLIQEFRFNRKGFVNELIRYGMDGEIISRFDIFGENTPFPMPGKPEFVDTVLTVVNFDSLGVIKGKEVKAYSINGLITEICFYEGKNSLIKKNTYKYNNQDMILEDVYWDVDLDKPKQKIRYEFEYFTD